MTTQDAIEAAFAIVFDEAVVEEKITEDKNPAEGDIKKNAAAAPTANVSTAGGGSSGSGDSSSSMSIAEHMQRYHPNGFDPAKDSCSLFDKMVGNLEASGMSKEEAVKQATQEHSLPPQEGTAEGQINPQEQAQKIQTMVENPETIETTPSEMLATPQKIETQEGDIRVELDSQEAIVKILQEGAARGEPSAIEGLRILAEATRTESPSPEQPSAEEPKTEAVAEQPEEVSQAAQAEETSTPADEEFEVEEDTYKIGNQRYVDVSGKGLFRGMLASFIAGLNGDQIITSWDRISGKWDQMKRSEKGERVRDGITAALMHDTIDGYAKRDNLSEEAKMEISNILDMLNEAQTPKDRMAAVKAFKKWKEEYAHELGQMDSDEIGVIQKPLPSLKVDSAAPLSILDKPKGFSADKEFGEQVATDIMDRLVQNGLMVEDVEGVKVGPSATTIEFKVPPSFDMTAASSKSMKEKLKGATGTEITKVGYAKGKKDILAIQVTNPSMRAVGFSDVLNGDEWKEFSQKAAVPIALGKDSSGKDKLLELTKMPHMLVTGATKSGKSVFLLSAINSAEMAKTPDELRMVIIDPKHEFGSQKGSPHLLYPIPSKKENIANVVASLRKEMEDRIAKVGGNKETYDPEKNEFEGNSNRNIDGYNAAHPEDKMPHIMMVFDEVADVLKDKQVGEKVGADLDQIMALGRSVGINCILATQRNDVKSLPGSIQANMPAHLQFQASKNDAKASAEAKSLAGGGDYILEANGESTRGRGCYISEKEVAAVPEYYRTHIKGEPESAKETASSPMPEWITNRIEGAIKDNRAIQLEKSEEYDPIIGKLKEQGWDVSELEEGGVSYWKATPPPKAKKAVEGNISVPQETDTENKEAKKEQPNSQTETQSDWREAENKSDAIEILKQKRDEARAKAREDFRKSKNTSADKAKFERAMKKADSEFHSEMESVNMLYDDIADGDQIEEMKDVVTAEIEPEAEGDIPTAETDDDSAESLMERAKSRRDIESEKIKKARDTGKITEREARTQLKALKDRYEAAEKKYNDGGSAEDILNILEPIEEKETGTKEGDTLGSDKKEGKNAQPSKPKQLTPEETEELKRKSREEDIERLKDLAGYLNVDIPNLSKEYGKLSDVDEKEKQLASTVKPHKMYKGKNLFGSEEAAERLTEKEQKKISETLIPPGWEFVTDNRYKSPARTKTGKIYVKHPTNGSYGWIYKGKYGNLNFWQEVDTTHPNYKGFVQNEKGEWVDSPGLKEAKKHRDAVLRKEKGDTKESVAKREEAKRLVNNAMYGHDEAPSNKVVVADAISRVLELVQI